MNQTVNINFNISGNAANATANISNNVSQLSNELKGVINVFNNFAEKMVVFSQISQSVQSLSDTISSTINQALP